MLTTLMARRSNASLASCASRIADAVVSCLPSDALCCLRNYACFTVLFCHIEDQPAEAFPAILRILNILSILHLLAVLSFSAIL